MRGIVVDNFAGGGGASTGIEMAIGRSVDIAINHDPAAIAMHKVNHPGTKHYCESVWEVDPVEACNGQPVDLAWFSPDCKHFSKAKGGKPVEKNIRGLAWVAVKWAKKVRPRVIMLENVEEFRTWGPLIPKKDKTTGRIIKKVYRSEDDDVIWDEIVSNPEEIVPLELQIMMPDPAKKGETFNLFVKALERLGYKVGFRELRACDYGAPTIRKRFFMIARCDGQSIVWPEPTHGDPDSLEVSCGLLQPWRTAAQIIDWSLPVKSIFGRKKPLAENTLKRIAKGIEKYVLKNPRPFIVNVNHGGDGFRGQETDEPMDTITAKHGFGLVTPTIMVNEFHNAGSSLKKPLNTILTGNHHYLVTPVISQIGHAGGGDRLHSIEDPLSTIVSKAEHMLVTPTLIQMGYGEREGQEPRVLDIDKPLGTITAGGNKFALAEAFITKYYDGCSRSTESDLNDPLHTVTARQGHALVTAFISKYYAGNYEGAGADLECPTPTITSKDHNALVTSHLIKFHGDNIGSAASEPVPTITAGGLHIGEVRAFLTEYYGTSIGQGINEPMHTIPTHDRFGLVTIEGTEYEIVDIGMRMLEPHELFAAQGFPPDYIIDRDFEGKPYPKTAQVARCGNAVCPPLPAALVRANLPELCGDVENAS